MTTIVLDLAKPTAALLRGAADKLQETGWTQFHLERDGKHCVMSALMAVANDHNVCQVATSELGRHLGIHALAIPLWNNTPDRTAAQVIATLHECADRLDPQ